ncbi:hypothetical protein M427DRAFT_155701 [Gonapodya prolifera JEL478]|uniref:Uncharacterized protein n=1 Tax=Gonapodya prolifera (strain JEL478) TaxID=1344416 RepID=A0A139ADF3_GONPJ|nr:hypothetical protein M427DRAFT_155701 [Gonapodya prolifera JEL478]|eukprot:KXS14800.1 hypothetical protein M427DRAFT_155701 [Gonapodya prolifera JEL478]
MTSTTEGKLYEDDHCVIYSDTLVIKSFYFPVPSSKTIKFVDIESIQTHEEAGLSWMGMKGWGMGVSDIWWSCDWSRGMIQLTGPAPDLTLVVVRVKGDAIRKGFSAPKGSKTLALLRELIPHVFHKSAPEDNKDK